MELTDIGTIKKLLDRHGFSFSKALGQNFLIASWVPERIAEESGVNKNDCVLEIGPGVGCLTQQLSYGAGKVVAVELDKRLPPLLAESLADCDNVEIISGDILKTDISQLVNDRFCGLNPKVCANLPYNITSPILTTLIETKLFETITVMVQKEVALRMCAKAGTSDYGAFTVFVNYYTEPEILFHVPPGCFMPQPKVTSSVITLKRRDTIPWDIKDEKLFFRVVKASFAQRRKTLVNGLSAGFSNLTKDDIKNIIESCGYEPNIRGETLDIPGFAKLANAIYDHAN
ncbi:MAG: 16S rRNA (adenine(1518)-N(6)/adenine(1519)-N(6))-dimethyltransferase RsmA [Ruminococcaceae bacterium]|nr:16S rRNA (adenine(1518)-N(6)/adenine(1519)-N(6))-dimethyltransferase RsmA [Oscillospiraceae bacterium]